MPFHGKIQRNCRERKTPQDRFCVFLEEDTSGETIDQFGIKGDRDILTVLIMVHVTGVKGVGIAEKHLPLFQVKGVLIDFIKHFAFMDISKFDLRMPVPEKGAGFVTGKPFVAYQKRKSAVTVLLQFFSRVICDDLHRCGLLS